MINKTESNERLYLEKVKEKLNLGLKRLGVRVRRYARDIREQKTYMWEHRAEMDHVEKISARQSTHQKVLTGETVLAACSRIEKLIQSPYFGRFDFINKNGKAQTLSVYVGIHPFEDETERKSLIFDWRAPISTMFYDFETGEAGYQSPGGFISGEILLKRQFRIRNGRMEFMLESGLSILDDVLQEELSRTSDDRMKSIVATIQRDQNVIIRNEDAKVLIIQGVAGSGKTSIALHRIAFLLYRFKDSLTAQDILIISPNKVFADFISNVLPELGEEQVAETGMEEIADRLLEYKFKFQTFFEQSALLLENNDSEMRRRIREKSSLNFLRKLDQYLAYVDKSSFKPKDMRIRGLLVPAAVIDGYFRKQSGMPASKRLRWVAESVEHYLWLNYRREITAAERAQIKASVRKMYRNASLRTIYREFFVWFGQPELFKPGRNGRLEYSDVFPIIYLKIRLEKIDGDFQKIKHLIVDEMQDYTVVQYAVISRLFPCEKTILGDANQSVNPFGSSSAETISLVFRQAESVKLCKSYRSSYEITLFAQAISPDADLVPIERHGEKPLVLGFKNEREETDHIRRAIEEFAQLGYRTMGIICKTQKQAERLHNAVSSDESQVHLMSAQSTSFMQGVVISTVHLAKGLEFDQVIVPDATDYNYSTGLDRNLLYIACTRAMHKLMVTYTEPITRFIQVFNAAFSA